MKNNTEMKCIFITEIRQPTPDCTVKTITSHNTLIPDMRWQLDKPSSVNIQWKKYLQVYTADVIKLQFYSYYLFTQLYLKN